MADVCFVGDETVLTGVGQTLLDAVRPCCQGFHGTLEQVAYIPRLRPVSAHAMTVAPPRDRARHDAPGPGSGGGARSRLPPCPPRRRLELGVNAGLDVIDPLRRCKRLPMAPDTFAVSWAANDRTGVACFPND